MKQYKIMHAQFMGSFNYFKIQAWNILRRLQTLRQADKLIKKIKEHGFPEHSAVMWLSSGQRHHRNLNKKTPWKWKRLKKKFDLLKPNKKFWKLYKKWLKIHKKHHLPFVPIMMMREDYCEYPFWHNVNGVTGFHDVLAMSIILKYIEKAVKIYIEVFGKTPMVIPWNEPNHHGDGHKFHKIMYDHEAVWEEALKPLGCRLKDIWPDLTASEGSGGELIERHDCPKPGTCDRLGRHGKEWQDRKILGIKHDFTTLADFMVEVSPGLTKLQNMVQSANHWRLYTEDGGGTVNDGRYLAGPFNIPCGDAEQQYEMMNVLIDTWVETGFLPKFGTFPHECLTVKRKSDGSIDLFIPDYRPRVVNWTRIKDGVLKSCREKLGE